MRGIANFARRAGGAVCGADPRTKIVVLLSLSVATFVADGRPRLATLLVMAIGWAVLSASAAEDRRPGRLVWLAVALALVGLGLWTAEVRTERFAGPVVRTAILLASGWAFSASTSPGDLAWGLERFRCPKTVVFAAMVTWNLAGFVVSEAHLAWEGVQIRARCAIASRTLRTGEGLVAGGRGVLREAVLRGPTRGWGRGPRRVLPRPTVLVTGEAPQLLRVVLGGACAALPLVAALV